MKMEATLIHHLNADELIKLFTDLQNQINELKLHYPQLIEFVIAMRSRRIDTGKQVENTHVQEFHPQMF